MDDQLKSNLLSGKHWLRLIFMILFGVILYVAFAVVWAVVALQFLFALITGNDNVKLRHFGDAISQFIFQILQFLTYGSEKKPFPFSEWPASNVDIAEEEKKRADAKVVVDSNSEPETSVENDTAEEPKDPPKPKRTRKPKATENTETATSDADSSPKEEE